MGSERRIARKEIRELVAELESQGFRVEWGRNSHLRVFPPDPSMPPYWLATTPSDWRGWRNTIAELRRRGAVLAMPQGGG